MSSYEGLSEIQQFACRVIADHARSTAFAIADGILPGNEGRNYVLRKIMRRAIYHGREHLGLKDAFFYKVCDLVVENFSGAFPELAVQRDFIGKMVRLEEERFGNTLTVGARKFSEFFTASEARLRQTNPIERRIDEFRCGLSEHSNPTSTIGKIVKEIREFEKEPHTSSEYERAVRGLEREIRMYEIARDFAPLFDTYGYPSDLIRVGLEERGLIFPEGVFNQAFEDALKEVQERSGIGKTERKSQISPIYLDVLNRVGPTRFVGYDETRFEGAKVLSIIRGDVELLILEEGEEAGLVLDITPFYAESGGQMGDSGVLTTDHGTILKVLDTYAPLPNLIIHKVRAIKGNTRPYGDDLFVKGPDGIRESPRGELHRIPADNQLVTAVVDEEKRDATRRNHTATHLVHAALKEVLGTHVKQAGSVVAPSYLRFDFTHYQPMNDAEIGEVEDLVNRYILQNAPVTTNMMALEEAMRSGAVAMFGEKYGSEVRVLRVGDGKFSMELCGGTHVRATGDIGSFKITSDEAIASGVRRIRAITGFDAFARFREDEVLIDRSLDILKTQRDQLPNAIERLQDELKRTRREIDELKLKIATGAFSEASSNGDEARDIAGIKVIGKIVEGLDANGMRQLSDTLLARLKSGVVVIGRREEGKAGIIVRVSDDLTAKVKAGSVIKEIVPIVGGKGGGRADMAEGGGSEPEKLGEAIDASYRVIENFLST